MQCELLCIEHNMLVKSLAHCGSSNVTQYAETAEHEKQASALKAKHVFTFLV